MCFFYTSLETMSTSSIPSRWRVPVIWVANNWVLPGSELEDKLASSLTSPLPCFSGQLECFYPPKSAVRTTEMNVFLITSDQGEWLNLCLPIPSSLTVHLKNTAAGFVCAQDRSPHTEAQNGCGDLICWLTMSMHLHWAVLQVWVVPGTIGIHHGQ